MIEFILQYKWLFSYLGGVIFLGKSFLGFFIVNMRLRSGKAQ